MKIISKWDFCGRVEEQLVEHIMVEKMDKPWNLPIFLTFYSRIPLLFLNFYLASPSIIYTHFSIILYEL